MKTVLINVVTISLKHSFQNAAPLHFNTTNSTCHHAICSFIFSKPLQSSSESLLVSINLSNLCSLHMLSSICEPSYQIELYEVADNQGMLPLRFLPCYSLMAYSYTQLSVSKSCFPQTVMIREIQYRATLFFFYLFIFLLKLNK